MKFSIIIPVYNDDGTLQRCLDSVLSQSFTDYEVIVVDDGSTTPITSIPRNLEISKSRNLTTSKPQNLKTLRINHAGLSAARNAGIQEARGEWLIFIDSDDWIAPQTLDALDTATKQYHDCDIIEYPVIVHEGAKDEYHLKFDNREYTDLQNDYWLGCKAYSHSYAWNKTCRKSLFNEVQFPVGKKFEDVYTLPQLLDHAKKVRTISQGLYHYVWNNKGICAKANGEDLSDLLSAHVNVMQNWGLEKAEGFAEYYMHVLNTQIDVYRLSSQIMLPEYTIRWHKMGIAARIKYLIYKFMGLKTLCKIWKILS